MFSACPKQPRANRPDVLWGPRRARTAVWRAQHRLRLPTTMLLATRPAELQRHAPVGGQRASGECCQASSKLLIIRGCDQISSENDFTACREPVTGLPSTM